jgi:hypothetical protein
VVDNIREQFYAQKGASSRWDFGSVLEFFISYLHAIMLFHCGIHYLKNVIPGLLYPGKMIPRLKSYLMILKS